ncbi:HlyD family efflux transporter periplasmic adaptor subunit [Nitrobacter sp. JJSN]|uniref:HlyD family efflux transporter periplasmic adaptor subunit n=1 Tax=Nitrobacter sp. JJSN TaxID=3453033 RepID=UPI003F75AE22
MSDSTTSRSGRPAPGGRHPVILRVSSLVVAGVLSALMVTAVVPPIVADQSDRAVVDAPVKLLTAPINGDIDSLSATPGGEVNAGDVLARISNARLDRTTLIMLEQKTSDARQKLAATQEKRSSDLNYLTSLNEEIDGQLAQLKSQFKSQIEELRAKVAESDSLGGAKKALVDRQTKMVERNTASMDMLNPTLKQYSAALHNTDAEKAKLGQKIGQLEALEKGIYVGDDLTPIATLVQKRRDIDLDAKRLAIEETELSAQLADQKGLIDAERTRLDKLAAAEVRVPGQGMVLTVQASKGRHVSAGDALASLIDCEQQFVVAIFSYRQGQNLAAGTHVRVDGAPFKSGIITSLLPKTSDKLDERYAVPFPQTERREMYAIVMPDQKSGDGLRTESAEAGQSAPCSVGKWVTVTRDNGVAVPSMSVAWRQLAAFVTSWGSANAQSLHERNRKAGHARLSAKFREAPQDRYALAKWKDWPARTEAVVAK